LYDRKRIIRDIPFTMWIFGLVIIGIGIFGYFRGFLPIWMSLLLIGIGVVLILLPAVVNVYVDSGRRILEIERIRLIGSKRIEVQTNQISRIFVERRIGHDSEGSNSYTYRVILILDTGEQIPLSNSSTGARRKHERHAEAIREAIGIDSVDRSPESLGEAFAQAMHLMPVPEQESITGVPVGVQESDGIRWQLDTFQIGGPPEGSIVHRWSSTDVDLGNDFVYLVQRMEGVGEQKGLMKLAGKFLIKTSLQMFGFDESYTPGIDHAKTVEDVDKRLLAEYFIYTNDPSAVHQLINPWIVMPLIRWSDRYALARGKKEMQHQLSVLFSPLGLYVSLMGKLDQAEIDELVAMGLELVRAK